ncbi:MAG: ABC transporter ATP-binding protein [Defluviimonas sp.]|nr:ABC transporter ATP-binding protein [Defluviimonas sp.]
MKLSIEALVSGYGLVDVLHGVSIEMAEGEVVAVIGPNGAGKSTLLRTISGLVAARSGTVRYDGREIGGLAASEIPRLGLVHVPEARHVFGKLTVEQNLVVGASAAPAGSRKDALAEVYDLFPMLGQKARELAGGLSGGQQQMLAVGRALMARPGMIMLDEPSLGLAPLVVEQMYEALDGLRRSGLTILLVEQDVYMALDFASRAYVLENGRIALAGASAALRHDDHVRRSYLGI